MSSPIHTVLWRRLDLPGHDIWHLWRMGNDWQWLEQPFFYSIKYHVASPMKLMLITIGKLPLLSSQATWASHP